MRGESWRKNWIEQIEEIERGGKKRGGEKLRVEKRVGENRGRQKIRR